MVHVDAGTPYVDRGGPEGIELVGGPSPADPPSTSWAAGELTMAVRVFHRDQPDEMHADDRQRRAPDRLARRRRQRRRT